MSVAMVMRNFSARGGLELYAHRLIEGLLLSDHRVTVFCDQQESAFHHENLSVIRLESKGKPINKREQLDYYFIEFSELLRKFGPFDIVHTQQLAIENPDVAHFHNHTIDRIIKNGRIWERCINYLKLKLVPSYRARNKSDWLLASKAKVLVFPSFSCKSDYEKTYNLLSFRDPESHIVAYPGASVAFVDHHPSSHSKQRDPKGHSHNYTFLFVGRGYRTKGLDVLLSACGQLVRKGLKFKLLIAGLKKRMHDSARLKLLGIDQFVDYLGYVDNISDLYGDADAIVQPSRYETFGMSVLQAMHCGLVPVVSRNCGISEVLTDEGNALVLENHLSGSQLAHLMERLIREPGLSAYLSQQAAATASQFSWRNTVDVCASAYDRILDRSPNFDHRQKSSVHSVNPAGI
jgi:UDP-glucose:(heptosyl)LPS alpha-1,3-glucosyltransferase